MATHDVAQVMQFVEAQKALTRLDGEAFSAECERDFVERREHALEAGGGA